MVSKRNIDERALAWGKSGTNALELYNIAYRKNEITIGKFLFIYLFLFNPILVRYYNHIGAYYFL